MSGYLYQMSGYLHLMSDIYCISDVRHLYPTSDIQHLTGLGLRQELELGQRYPMSENIRNISDIGNRYPTSDIDNDKLVSFCLKRRLIPRPDRVYTSYTFSSLCSELPKSVA